MSDAARDIQHDIALLLRAIKIGSEANAYSGLSADEAVAISAERARLWSALVPLTDRLTRNR